MGTERKREPNVYQPIRRPPEAQGQGQSPQITYFLFSLDMLVLQGKEVQIGHLQLCLAGFKKTADVPVDTRTRSGVDHIGRE